jgi:hypothetical protein
VRGKLIYDLSYLQIVPRKPIWRGRRENLRRSLIIGYLPSPSKIIQSECLPSPGRPRESSGEVRRSIGSKREVGSSGIQMG